MNKPSDKKQDWESLRKKVIGLGEESIRKSYYPELQQRLKELQESEAKFRDIFDSVHDVILVEDIETGALLDVNQQVCDIFGYTREEIDQENIGILSSEVYPSKKEKALELRQKAVAGEPQFFEWQVKHKSGRFFWLEGNLRKAMIGGHERLLIVGRDITSRKQAEDEKHALEQSMEDQKRKFYRQIILSVTEGKLEICDDIDVEPFINCAQANRTVREALDVGVARREIENICSSYGLEEEPLHQLIIAAGEVITNAIKHAEGGLVFAGKTDNEVWVGVADKGPGIESLILPSAVLRRGWSTKPSLGLGYSIVLDACDRVLLKTGPDGTTVILFKNLKEKNVPLLSAIPDTWETIP